MSDIENQEPMHDAPQPSGGNTSSHPSDRRRTFSFILIFSVIVLTLLTGYRYTIDTRFNDWYLFNVAKHTAWMLDAIGHSAVLEDVRRQTTPPAEARASIASWLKGEDAPTPEQIETASDEPLTAWESWSYKALKQRNSGEIYQVGPHVAYIWRPGISTHISEKEHERGQLLSFGNLSEEEKKLRLDKLGKEIAQLQQEQIKQLNNPEQYKSQRDLSFSFIVIPECGAIEIMAIFLAAVVAFPTSRKKKIFGLLGGLPLMYLVNIFRLSCLGIIGALDQSQKRIWFNFAHEYVWQVIYIVFVVIVWLMWVEFVVRRREE